MFSISRLALFVLSLLATCICSVFANEFNDESSNVPLEVDTSISIYLLSRGRGVPQEGRDLLLEIKQLLESLRDRGIVVSLSETRIGLEGELRLCAKFASSKDTAEAWQNIAPLTEGVGLVNMHAEECE